MGERPPIDPANDPRRCGYYGNRKKRGTTPCGGWVIKGTQRCRQHAGRPTAQAKAEGAVVVELRRWGLDGHTTIRDAGEVLLRLVTQSAARCELYARLLAEAYDAAERLRAAHEAEQIVLLDAEPRFVTGFDGDPVVRPEHAATQVARSDLDRIFNSGGVAALVGRTYAATKDGDVYATGEAIRGLAKLEADERDRCASFAAKAVAAGLAERQVRIAEQQGALTAATFRAALDDVDLPAEWRQRVEAAFVRRMSQIADPLVIDGTAA